MKYTRKNNNQNSIVFTGNRKKNLHDSQQNYF